MYKATISVTYGLVRVMDTTSKSRNLPVDSHKKSNTNAMRANITYTSISSIYVGCVYS